MDEVLQKISVEFPELKNVLGPYLREMGSQLVNSKNGKATVVFLEECPKKNKEALIGQYVVKAMRFFDDVSVMFLNGSNSKASQDKILAKPIEFLEPNVILSRACDRLGVETVGQLIEKTPEELLNCDGFGPLRLDSVREKLLQYDLKLKGD